MRKLFDFIRDIKDDERIPVQNRLMLGGLLIYLLTPVDIIPDWIPILGWIDDAFVTVIVLDYIFNSADSELILEHYPWNKRGFRSMKNYVARMSWMVPPTVKRILFRQAERYALKSAAKKETNEIAEGL